MKELRREDLIYPALSYKIVGCAFDVHNELGGGHHEKYYQRALAEALRNHNLIFKEQVYYSLKYHGKIVGKGFVDFIVNDKIIVEIKKGDRYSKRHIDQVLEYLKLNDFKLAILVNFGSDKVSFTRIVNFNS